MLYVFSPLVSDCNLQPSFSIFPSVPGLIVENNKRLKKNAFPSTDDPLSVPTVVRRFPVLTMKDSRRSDRFLLLKLDEGGFDCISPHFNPTLRVKLHIYFPGPSFTEPV